jgi:hypothetical protein
MLKWPINLITQTNSGASSLPYYEVVMELNLDPCGTPGTQHLTY